MNDINYIFPAFDFDEFCMIIYMIMIKIKFYANLGL